MGKARVMESLRVRQLEVTFASGTGGSFFFSCVAAVSYSGANFLQ